MSGLILELQTDCLDSTTRVADLLRKALVVSKKLSLVEMEAWIESELSGYGTADVPAYRMISGQLKVFNPYRGWQPLNFGNPEWAEALSTRGAAQSISELEKLSRADESAALQMPFDHKVKNMIMDMMEIPLEPTLQVSSASISGIFDAVRNKILKWTLDLEKRGILGHGLSFTQAEKAAAANYSVVNIGTMTNSQFQQHSPGANQALEAAPDTASTLKFAETLLTSITALQLSQVHQDELQSDVITLQSQAGSPKPKPAIVRESLRSIRTVLEGAAGSVLASDLTSQAIALLAMWAKAS